MFHKWNLWNADCFNILSGNIRKIPLWSTPKTPWTLTVFHPMWRLWWLKPPVSYESLAQESSILPTLVSGKGDWPLSTFQPVTLWKFGSVSRKSSDSTSQKWGSRWHGHVLFDLNRIRTHISRQNIFSLIENTPRKHDYTYLGVFNVRRRGIDSMVIDPWVFLKIWVTHTLSWIGFWGKW